MKETTPLNEATAVMKLNITIVRMYEFTAPVLLHSFNFSPRYVRCDKSEIFTNTQFVTVRNIANAIQWNRNTVKPLNSGHHWFLEKVSAIERFDS